MPKLVALSLVLMLAGCVTTEVDEHGNPVKREKSDEIAMDAKGRLVVRPTLLIAPHTIVVNGNSPTEREIRLLGVEGLPESEAPVTFAKCQEYLARYVAPEGEIFVKPALNTDLKKRVIYGVVYLQAYENENGKSGAMIPDRYLCLNQAMLSKGLVKIRDAMEISDEAERKRMMDAEAAAKKAKEGLWSGKP